MKRLSRLIKSRYVFYFGLDFVSLLIFWGGMLRKSFTSDTISHMVAPDADVQYVLEQGRYVRALGDYLLLKLGLRTTTNLSISMFLAFVGLALAMVVLQKSFGEWEPEETWGKLGYHLILNLWIYNVLFVENLMFSEMSVYFALAYLAAALAVRFYQQKKYSGMILALLVAACTYQYAVVFAAIYVAFYIFMQERRLSLRAVVRELIGVAVCMGMGVADLASVLLLVKLDVLPQFSKSAGLGDLKLKLSEVLESFVGLWRDAAGIFPGVWLPLLVMLAVGGLLLLEVIKKKRFKELLFLLIVSVGSFALLYVIPMAQENFYFPPRMSFCFFLVQGMIMTAAYGMIDTQISRKLLTLCGIGYLVVHMLFADFVVTNHFVSNSLDKVYVRMAYEYITKYEQENQIQVQKLSMVNDIDAPARYREVSYVSDQINERSLGILTVSIMEVVTGRKFDRVEMDPEVYDTYFAGKNWDHFDPYEQIVIVGDTAYWCMF